ncbi:MULTISPECIES: DeoR/GlpR family DNA-binding transcription regulator [Peribacillus]|uniref:DeoR/GlpR family DNA-binding transcription regulator n=1 Tax=Peribacillus TaxID=2675229 RepID=UPI001070BF94|nr:DeoR/GlpR family DNA-binding transcription regulator [Peribacillus frigoritolerans]MEC0300367.1 DeoR/GlpR family DNA-binding transcription regulator [Peribacillus castrilensis]TFH62256.1 DeoR/GlpR transcriptional regulator [Peribacillus frigoritolerans]
MLQDERLDAIVQYLNEHERIDIETICKINNVSKDTARRDLINLEEMRKIIRIRGGAKKALLSNEVHNYGERMNMASEAKGKIGKFAASLINNGDHLILDASTTVQFSAKYLTSQNNTVVTNSINIASVLSQREDIKVNLLGGTLSTRHQAIYGSRAIRDIQDYKVNKCIIGTCGISAEGLSTSIEEEGLLVHEMIKRSDQVIVIADSTKFNKTFFQKVCDLNSVDIVITDKEVPKNMQEILNKHVVEVIVVPSHERDE